MPSAPCRELRDIPAVGISQIDSLSVPYRAFVRTAFEPVRFEGPASFGGVYSWCNQRPATQAVLAARARCHPPSTPNPVLLGTLHGVRVLQTKISKATERGQPRILLGSLCGGARGVGGGQRAGAVERGVRGVQDGG